MTPEHKGATGGPAHGGRRALPAWQALERHVREDLKDQTILGLFEDPHRFGNFSRRGCGIFIDFSKTLMTDDTFAKLLRLARDANIESRRNAMLCGETINTTEGRAVLHTALRRMDRAPVMLDGRNIVEDVEAVVDRMAAFVGRVHSGEWTGHTGKRITDIVNIGIGGSDLGPRMVCRALKPFTVEGITPHFVSNVDSTDIADTLERVDPETTLFIVSSKSFTTLETMANAMAARRWFLEKGGTAEAIAKHFVAVSTNIEAVQKFGIDPDNAFEFWDWVGGRYSLWSAIGLSIALALGMDNFNALRTGAFKMDRHFAEAPLEDNLPVLLALVGVWHANFQHHPTWALLPYSDRLSMLPDYLQQADMESNGKRVTHDGIPVDYATAPVLWGNVGTNAQHSFFQHLHQGTQIVPADFIAVVRPDTPEGDLHRLLMANFFAQTEALMRGRTMGQARALHAEGGMDATGAAELAPHTTFPGGRPSTTILLHDLTPETLGRLIALYEHKIFCQGVIWDINSFDQFGVELGKKLAKHLLETGGETGVSCSTRGLIEAYNKLARDSEKL